MKTFLILMICMMSLASLSQAETLSAVDSAKDASGAAVNEICPMNYHCNVSSTGETRCLPNDQSISVKGSESCFSVARLCKKYLAKIAKGKELNKSEAKKFPYYCS